MRLPIKSYARLLAAYLKPQRWRVALMAALLVVGTGLQFLNPQILRYFIDTALAGGASAALLAAAIVFVLVALLQQGVTVAATSLTTNVAWTATNHLRTDLVAHCLALDMTFHKSRTPGELIERIDGDVDLLSTFFSEFTIKMLTNLLLLLGALVLYFVIDWRVGLTMTAFVLVAGVVLAVLRRRALPYWRELRQQTANFYGFLGEHLAGTADLRANGATAYVLRRFWALQRAWLPPFRSANLLSAAMNMTRLLLFVWGSVLVLGLGVYLWTRGIVTVGTVYLMFSYTDLLSMPLQELQDQLQSLQQAEACIARVEDLLSIKPTLLVAPASRRVAAEDGPPGSAGLRAKTLVAPATPQSRGTAVPGSPSAPSVEFREVSFGYAAEEAVLQDISFRLEPGRVLGVLGRTGSGKTTLARLLFRLYDPQAGAILLGGVPITQPALSDLRRQIGMVTQEVQLFQATVRDNLTFFNHALSDSQIVAALEQVGLLPWYQKLSDGLETMLGAEGTGLSAGEAQLLAFARVFLTNPGLVILDEASSRLDPATERLLERAIGKLFAGRTAIVIAHRLATIQRADDILILEDGRVLEYGPRVALAGDPNSRLSRLLRVGLEEVLA
ncbi:MAG TPA: ABC transporter ATP-binding protein [Ktedonobacterales bacterium]